MDTSVRLVLAFIGDDGPGLVHALAEVLADHGGNWEFSHMNSRDGLFAGILEVSVPIRRAEDLIEDFRALDGMLDVIVRRGKAEPTETDGSFRLVVSGPDRPGIVEVVAAAIARPAFNVHRFHSESFGAEPDPTFAVTVVARPDPGADLDSFLAELREATAPIGAEVSLSPNE